MFSVFLAADRAFPRVEPRDEVIMPNTIDKFCGVNVEVSDLSGDPKEFLVRFTTGQIGSVRRVRDTSHQVVVVVRLAREPEVVGYIPPEVDFPNLGQEDFERRALIEVRDHLAAVR